MTLYIVIAVIWIRNINESRVYLCTAKIKTTITDVDSIIESMIDDYCRDGDVTGKRHTDSTWHP